MDLVQVARAHHVQAESYLVYSIMSSGEIECGNTLEDALDQALPSQAFVYRPVRQRVYALLLGDGRGEPRLRGPRHTGSSRTRSRQNRDNRKGFCVSAKSVIEKRTRICGTFRVIAVRQLCPISRPLSSIH